MNFSQKYPVLINEVNDDIETGFTKVNLEFSQLFTDLQTVLSPNGHVHYMEDITDLSSGSFIPVGGIIDYYGYFDDIPEQWALCDGTNGTPDLRNIFVVGAGIDKGEASTITFANDLDTIAEGYYPIGATGGEDRHQLTVPELAAHAHSYSEAYIHDSGTTPGSPLTYVRTGNSGVTGSDYAHENRPRFYALAKIMRIS